MNIGRGWVFLALLFLGEPALYAQDRDHPLQNAYDFGEAEGITIYGELPSADEEYILGRLSGSPEERKNFIERDFLVEAGFRGTGNVKFRKSDGSEKALSVLHGIGHAFTILPYSLGFISEIVPLRPFLEIEYGELPRGEYYHFESVIYTSKYKQHSPEILAALELEYKLQIEFCNGVVYSDNRNYYTEENIQRFEELSLTLPDSIPRFRELRERYLKRELPKIKAAMARYKNPSENYLRAMRNLQLQED